MKRLLLLIALFPLFQTVLAQDYPVSFPEEQTVKHSTRRVFSVGLSGTSINVRNDNKVYKVALDRSLVVRPGQTVTASMGFNEDWMNEYVYIDYNRNGQYDIQEPLEDGSLQADNELVSYSCYKGLDSAGKSHPDGNYMKMPAFTIPADIEEGYYRMRFKLDWNNIDPAGCMEEGEDIVKNGGVIIDVRLLVTNAQDVAVSAYSEHGEMVYHTGDELHNSIMSLGQDLPCLFYAEDGYQADSICVRHGNLSGDSLKNGLPQYADTWFGPDSFNQGLFNIPGCCMDGDVVIIARFRPLQEEESMPEKAWRLTFCDDFAQENGSQPNPEWWGRYKKSNATWARYISSAKELAYIDNGELVLRCIPDPARGDGDDTMISGVVSTKDIYAFKYGRTEARLKTKKHTGNFPAFWLMPQDNSDGWPNDGEIDVFETIDNQDRAWHTVHSNWTYNLGKTNNPQSSFNESVTVEEWHVYGMEWDEAEIRWYLDGEKVFTYKKSQLPYNLRNGQWPFDREFYLILNQSVGNGVWAANHDPNFTYEMRVDWVRVYELDTPNILPAGILPITYDKHTDNHTYDMMGRRVNKPGRGVYIRNGKKIILK